MTTITSTLWLAVARQRGEPVTPAQLAKLTPSLTNTQRTHNVRECLLRGHLLRTTAPDGRPAVTVTPLCTVPTSIPLRDVFEALAS